ncbi:hypothetical protein EAG_11426, partial [Camponotus floridanus]
YVFLLINVTCHITDIILILYCFYIIY